MARIEPIAHELADGRAREMLDEFAARGTEPGPMVREMANAPALLRSYLDRMFAAPAEITDEQVRELRDLGYTDEQIAEVPGLVALNVLTGAFNLVAGIRPSTSARSAA